MATLLFILIKYIYTNFLNFFAHLLRLDSYNISISYFMFLVLLMKNIGFNISPLLQQLI